MGMMNSIVNGAARVSASAANVFVPKEPRLIVFMSSLDVRCARISLTFSGGCNSRFGEGG